MDLKEWTNNYIQSLTEDDSKSFDDESKDPQEIMVGSYQTKYFDVCPGASTLYKDIESKGVDMDIAERSAKLQDVLFFIEKKVLSDGYVPHKGHLMAAKTLAEQILVMAKMMDLTEEHNYIQGHIDKISKVVNKGEITEKNVPTNPSKWSYYKSQAKKKFDVYPSAYANAWAAKKYKAAGGGWRKESVNENRDSATKKLNSKLTIKRVGNRQVFKDTKSGKTYSKNGFAFHIQGKGYVGFEDGKGMPYIPGGGKNALQSILDQGGFLNYKGMVFVNPVNESVNESMLKFVRDEASSGMIANVTGLKRYKEIDTARRLMIQILKKKNLKYSLGEFEKLGKQVGDFLSGERKFESVNEATEPEIITKLRDIVSSKQNKKIKDPKSGKKMTVDLFSASAVTKVYDALKQQSNKDGFAKLGLPQMVNVAFKVMKKSEGFASDAQRRAAFASGYKAKGKKKKNESVNEVVSKIKMNNLDWGKSTAERNTNLDKYYSLKTDKERKDFLIKLKGESVNESKFPSVEQIYQDHKIKWIGKPFDYFGDGNVIKKGAKGKIVAPEVPKKGYYLVAMIGSKGKEVRFYSHLNKFFKLDEPLRDPTNESVNKSEGFASDAQRKAAFASGYKAKGKKGKKKKSESVNEANDTFFRTASDAVDYARKMIEKRGFEIDEDDWQSQIAMGGRYSRLRPSKEKTHSFSIGLLKNGKPQRKMLQISLYGMPSGKYELTYYVN